MSDLTPLLNVLLSKHDAHCASHPPKRSDTRDEFLKEAYRIVKLPQSSVHTPALTFPLTTIPLRMITYSTSEHTFSPSAPPTSPPPPHRAATSPNNTAQNKPSPLTSTIPPATPSTPPPNKSSATSMPLSANSPKENPYAGPSNP